MNTFVATFSGLVLPPQLFTMIGMMVGVGLVIVSGLVLAVSSARGDAGVARALPTFILGAAIMAFAGFVVPWLFDSSDTTTPVATPTPTATTDPSPPSTSTPAPVETAPPPSSEPADLTVLFIALAVIAGLICLVVLARVITTVIRRSRTARAEAKEARDRITQAWQGFHDHHNELLRKILHAETDWDALFFTPALSDPNVPQTHAMLRAMRVANTLRDTSGLLPRSITPDTDVTRLPYARSVNDFALAWDTAERHARQVGQKGIPLPERKTLKEIRTLLDIAENSAASPTERTLAYRRAQSLLEGLESVHIPAKVLAQLEEQQRLMLTAQP